jgi:hypothetical protein
MQNWNDDPFANLGGNLAPETNELTLENNQAQGAIVETATQIRPEETTAPETPIRTTGLEKIEIGARRIQVDDKKIINCRADLNQLVPFKYDWAWQNI